MVSFLIDEKLAVDAGSITSELSLSEQEKIKAILLTHPHYDHIKSVPSFIFNNLKRTNKIYATKKTLEILSTHFFDGVIYPKFTEKTEFLDKPPIKLISVEPLKQFEVEDYTVLGLPINHTKGSIGFNITSKEGKSVFFTGDTGPNLVELWDNVSPDLIIIDVTFPNKMKKTAINAYHLTPNLLKNELISFKEKKGYLPKIVIIHLSPIFEEEIKKEIIEISKKLNQDILIAKESNEISI